jgi:predicted Zn-dependent peptidase
MGLRCRSTFLPALLLGTALCGQNLKQFEKKVTEFTLANGLHFIVVERHDAPVISFRTWVDAGSLDDPAGATGLAHLFEHLAYKGTETIGTADWASEKKALDAVEEVYDRLQAERNKGPRADQERLDVLDLQLQNAINQAQGFVRPNEFAALLEANGAMGLSAVTVHDRTEYACSLPSNRIELWFLMESQRFLSPVFRDFYKERDALLEEQRVLVERNPQGLMRQEFLAAAFEAHPYHHPAIGWPSDAANLRYGDARAFFEKYYTAGNTVIAMVGDVFPDEARRLAERYFGPLPARPAPPILHTVEPPQRGTKRIQMQLPIQPMLLCGYKRPDQRDPDDPALRVLGLILSGGRTGMLYKELVEDQRIALEVQAVSAYPDGRYPSLFAFLLVPAKEHTVEENEKSLEALVARLQTQKVDDEILNRARNRARARLISFLDGNQGLASQLPAYYAAYGDWRKLFTSIADLNQVTADDVQRVARKYLVASQRTVVYSTPPPPQPAPARGGRR